MEKNHGALTNCSTIKKVIFNSRNSLMDVFFIPQGVYRNKNLSVNEFEIPMSDYIMLKQNLFERYKMKFHIGYKTKVKKQYEELYYADWYGQFVQI